MHRRALLATSLLAVSSLAYAQGSYPERPVRLVVPYAPGGSADIAARLINDAWGKELGQSIVVDNRSGAGGNLGVDLVAKAAPDGYTIGLQTVSLAINPSIYPKMPYDTLKDLEPIGLVASSQHVLVATPKLPADDVKQLVALAQSKPGKLSYGSAGAGSTFHIAAELFKSEAKVSILHVPYRGGGPAMLDTMGGQVDMSFPVLSAALPNIQAGKLKALGVTGPKRSSMLPNVPTIAEAGVPKYAFETWFIVFAPANTPKPVLEKLNAGLRQALSTPAVKERMTREGFDPILSTPAEARKRLEQEMPRWAKLVKEQGITTE